MALPPADFTGYAPATAPGAYVFQRRNGSPVTFGGPLAERLRQQLDASAPPDNRNAGLGDFLAALDRPGGLSADKREAEAANRTNTGGMSVAPPQAPEPNQSVAPAEPPPMSQAPAPAEAQRPQARGPQVVASGKGGAQYYRDEAGNLRVRSGGSAGTSKAQLSAKAGQGVELPSRTETSREFQPEGDPAYLDNMAGVSDQRRALNVSSAVRQAQAADAEAAAYAEQAAAQEKRLELETNTAARIREEAKRAELEYDQARAEYREAKIDPNRMFRPGLGTFRLIGAAIAQALGAYGATIGRTQNFAQQIVQSAIDRDIDAQREDIRRKGLDVDNSLANLTRKVGDQRAAESILRSQQGEYAANLLKARAAAAKRPEIIEMARKWDIDEQERQVKTRQEYLQARQGKIVQKVAGEFAYPTAGSGPSDRPATLDEQAQFQELQGKRLANEKAAIDVTNAEQGGGEVSKEAASNFATISALKGDIERVASQYGFAVDPTTGEIKAARPDAGFPGRGKGLIPGLPNAPEHDQLHSDLVKIGRSTAGVLNPQGEPSPMLVESNTPNAAAPDANILARLKSAYQLALERERALGAGAKPGERETLERRRQAVTIEQNQRAAQPRANVRPE